MLKMSTSEKSNAKLPLAPFLVVDVLFLGLAIAIFAVFLKANRTLEPWEAVALIVCTGLAGWSITYPVLRRYTDSQAASQTAALAGTVSQINRLDELAAQITAATAQWQSVQSYAVKISASSKDLVQSMNAEVKNFSELFEKADDAEKAHLRLEVDKLHRTEIEWIQVSTRLMDHVYALYFAAVRSGQQNIIEQIGQFQEACREAVRRTGLIPVVVAPGSKFDAQIHQLLDESAQAPENAIVENTLVTGFTFQGQLIRRAVVSVQQAPMGNQPAQPTTGELGLA